MKTFYALLATVTLIATADLTFAQSTTGSGIYRRAVPAYGTTTIFEQYYSGGIARISLVGDGDTDLDIFVYDGNGNLIVSGTGLTDREYVSFVPRWTGNFRIVIRNLGRVHNNCVVHTN